MCFRLQVANRGLTCLFLESAFVALRPPLPHPLPPFPFRVSAFRLLPVLLCLDHPTFCAAWLFPPLRHRCQVFQVVLWSEWQGLPIRPPLSLLPQPRLRLRQKRFASSQAPRQGVLLARRTRPRFPVIPFETLFACSAQQIF